MAEKKRGYIFVFVLLFSMILYLVPQGVFWTWTEGEIEYQFGVPCYLLPSGAEISLTDDMGKREYTYSCVELIEWTWPNVPYEDLIDNMLGAVMCFLSWPVFPMILVAYACAIGTLALFIEYLYQFIKKKDMAEAMRRTVKVLVVLTTIQYVMSLAYFWMLWPMDKTGKWMQGITFIQMLIVRGFRRSMFGKQKEGEKSSRRGILQSAIFLWMFGYFWVGKCFSHLINEYREGQGMNWDHYNAFLSGTFEWIGIPEKFPETLLVFAAVLGIMALACMVAKDEVRKNLLEKLERVLGVATVMLLGWIAGVCLFSPQMRETSWYFMPDAICSIWIGWGCWRLMGAGDKECVKVLREKD